MCWIAPVWCCVACCWEELSPYRRTQRNLAPRSGKKPGKIAVFSHLISMGIGAVAVALTSGLAGLSLATTSSQMSWTTVFFDDFQRPDGAPGPSWVTGLENQPPAVIQNHKLCSRWINRGDFQYHSTNAIPSFAPLPSQPLYICLHVVVCLAVTTQWPW